MLLHSQLLQFPLFQGMSRAELLQMAGNTRFGFLKLPQGRVVVREGEACQQLYFLVGGRLKLETWSADHSYHVEEQIVAPWLFQTDALFGLHTRYGYTVRTQSEAHFITLSKDEVLRLADDFLIIRLNLFNILSTHAQRVSQRPWRRASQSLEQRVVRFFTDHAVYPAGEKDVYILMKQLATEVSDTRLNVSRVLNELQDRQLLVLRRGCIHIPSLEHLLMG